MSKWNELTLSELPAIKLLKKIGYTYVSPSKLEHERGRLQEPVVIPRLKAAIKRINPWISDEKTQRIIDRLTRLQGTSEIEINHDVHELLVHHLSVKQDRGAGLRPYTVKVIDFDDPSNNEFVVTNQYRVIGPKKEIRCDIVCLINGLPVVVIEAKNPTLAGSTPEQAIKQLHRYQERDRGAPRLFHYTQVLLAINRVHAFVGTNGTPLQHFLEWKDPYPMTITEVEELTGRTPVSQDLAIVGVLKPSNLLDIIQNFTVFEVVDGKQIKKVTRYQQYRAVNKSIGRLLENWGAGSSSEKIRKRGGVIWHTQGSGKSLTMFFLATKLRRVTRLENPTVVIVTDRIDLDKQITSTFQRGGFPSPISATSTKHLRELIGQIDRVHGQTILTTIHKFQDKNRAQVYPELATSDNIIVLVDEGHRSQYKTLALNMRTAMPNATFIAFTGTPLIKRENITTSTFSSYIDKYSIDQAVEDGATVPIFYESRLPHLHVEKSTLDTMLDLEIEDYSEKDQEKIKKRYATLRNILGAESRIRGVAVDLYTHFRRHIHVNGFKAQVVAIDRLTAVRYKKILDDIIREKDNIECAVMYSSSPNDTDDLLKYKTTKEDQDKLIARFKDLDDPLSILVVVDMLLTGFDAPIEQVMYLDNVLKDHNLLQAIARVNRTYKNKNYGLIVDYAGISKYLQRALAIFEKEDIANALIPFSEAVKNLEKAHADVMEMFSEVEDLDDIDACSDAVSKDQKTLDIFVNRAKMFEKALDVVLPDPMANDYKKDYIFTVKLLEYLKNTGKSGITTDFTEIAMKIKQLIDEHVRSTGVQLIIPPVSILSPEFEAHLEMMGKSSKARALMMEHALKDEISENRKKNPEFYDSLSERLEKIIREYKQQRLSDAEFVEAITPLILEMKALRDTASSMGMSETEYAFYQKLASVLKRGNESLDREVKDLVVDLLKELKDLAIIDWKFKEDVQRKMRAKIKVKLLKVIKDSKLRDTVTTDLIELAKNHL